MVLKFSVIARNAATRDLALLRNETGMTWVRVPLGHRDDPNTFDANWAN